MITSHDASTRPPTRLAFHASRIVIDVGVLMVLGAMSLPFVTAEGFQQRAMAADALPALLLVLPIFVITLLPDQAGPIPTPLGWLSLLLAVAALPYTVVKYLDAATLAGTLGGGVGMGGRILVFGAFVILAGIAIGLARNLLPLPVAKTYPARPAKAPAGASRTSRRSAPSGRTPRPHRAVLLREGPSAQPLVTPLPGDPAAVRPGPPPHRRHAPRFGRTGTPPPDRRSGGPAVAPAPGRVPSQPRQADPDTEPTTPAQRVVRPWWPDELDDLFS